ncbi:unnamed protein product [Cyclocybe aegerita]|uniref:WLM domain-containing protein n=1 Tax=Cyclocybe aegerita TaxID=1973307 RepID=A0A8S0WFI9_CYCAE|nr:unnamed protein product [Cyclocybe aegerita]
MGTQNRPTAPRRAKTVLLVACGTSRASRDNELHITSARYKALEMLKKIASLVKPIMRKHGWVLPVLSEFFPDQQNLLGLNVNMGQNILVRLRPAHSPDWFLPLEEVVQTMLHELTHNVHGPHDDKFYKFLAGLQDEYDALQRSGYAGEGFYSEGRRLGISVSHNVPQHMARSKALEAAEKRLQTSRVLGSGGRLGGATRNSNLSPRELAARAAEQRLRDEKSCASGAVARREAEKAAQESVESKVIDLTLDDDDDYPVVGSDDDIVIVKDVHPKQGVSANSSRVKSQIPKTLSSGPVRSLKPQNQSTSKSSNKSDDLRSKPYPVRPKQPHPTKSMRRLRDA